MLVTKSQRGGSKQGQGNESCIILHTHLYLYLFILYFLFLAHIYCILYFLATAFTCTDTLPWFKICQYSQFDVNDGNLLVWLAFLCFWVWHWVSNYTVGYKHLILHIHSSKQVRNKQEEKTYFLSHAITLWKQSVWSGVSLTSPKNFSPNNNS